MVADFQGGNFVIPNPGSSITRYADFNSWFSALSGSAVTSQKYYWNSAGVYTLAPANTVAQPSYTSTGTIQGIQMEERETNVLLQSETFSSATWTKTGGAIVANNRTAPTGTMVASTFTEDASTGPHGLFQSIAKSAVAHVYTADCFFAPGAGARVPYIQLDDGSGNGAYAIFPIDPTANAPTPVGLGGGFANLGAWLDYAGSSAFVRIGLTVTSNTALVLNATFGLSDGVNLSYAGDGTSSLALWGCEVKTNSTGPQETATAPSSYVPTTTAAITRAIDKISMTLPTAMQLQNGAYSELINVTLARAGNNQDNTFTSLEDAGNTHRLTLLQDPSQDGGLFELQIVDTSTANVTMAGPVGLYNQGFGIAAVMQSGNYWTENSGQSTKTSTISLYPSTKITTLQLGAFGSGITTTGNIGLSQIAIFAAPVPTATMQSLLFAAPPVNPDAVAPPNYFTEDLSGLPPLTDAWRVARLPTSDSENNTTYIWYPLTVAYGQSIASFNTSTSTLVKYAWDFWGNRCDINPVSFTGAITGTTLTVSSPTGGKIYNGTLIQGAGVTAGTKVTALLSGTGGAGTYTVNNSQTVGSEAMSVNGCTSTVLQPNGVGPTYYTSDGIQPRVRYDTYNMADAATYAAVLSALNFPQHATTQASFTASVTGNQMTVSSVASGTLAVGQTILAGTTPIYPAMITALGTGSGGTGTYTISTSAYNIGSQPMTTVQCATGVTYCGVNDPPNAVGLTDTQVIPYAVASSGTNPDFYFPDRPVIAGKEYATTNNMVFLPNDALIGAGTSIPWGLACDCEMADSRLGSQTQYLSNQMALIVHNASYKYAILPDSLLSAGVAAGYCGVGATAANCDVENLSGSTGIVNTVDQFLLGVGEPPPKGYTFNSSLTAQYALLGTGFTQNHAGVVFNLGLWPGGTTVADANFTRSFMLTNGMGPIYPFPQYAAMGGSPYRCTNEKIQIILFGTFTAPIPSGC